MKIMQNIVLIETLWNVKLFIVIPNTDISCCINRNIVECKELSRCDLFCTSYCINRNIVECKVRNRYISGAYRYSINRNIVECKDQYQDPISAYDIGINRNIVECKVSHSMQLLLCCLQVLIETLWNVKWCAVFVSWCMMSINRNIVECKNLIFCLIGFLNDGINRTIVECKAF